MFKEDNSTLQLLKEHLEELTICLALANYIAGLLSLTRLGSPIFIFCNYIGTILLLSGVMTKVGMLPTQLRSKNAIAVTLLFISGLLLTTAVLTIFIDVEMAYKLSKVMPLTTPPSATNAGDYFDLPGPEVHVLGGPNLQLVRPYIWLFQPLLIASGILFIIAIAIESTALR